MRTAVSGVFNARTKLAGVVLPSDENYNLRFALTSLLAKNLYLEASVAFRLNGPGDAVTFGLSLPYTFGLRR